MDGILTVELEVILPEEKRPRKIEIGSNEENENGKFLRKIVNNWRRDSQVRQTIRELRALTDAELNDIGIDVETLSQ